MTTALALLLKAPVAGAVKTRLAAEIGAAKACAIYRQLVERQIGALPGEHRSVVYYDPPEAGPAMRAWLAPLAHAPLDFQPQCAGDLGARLADAFADAFRHHGARKVIALGGDCPSLDAALLRSADRALAQADVVLGPATDGGYYLIGLRAPQPGLFAGIAWSTASVLGQTREHIRRGGLSLAELPMADDVDTLTDWHRAVAQGLLAER
ncbi:MAG: TIGR04282 family arsenosugar biosynthesis glycosyltransferase [Opitutae bacterium]|nr:TIGR04282 family arsenosugar biosynthesis glycosyltransferase [Opitutae bacterium]